MILIINSNSPKPIYVQIAEWLETEILNGHLKKDEKVYSQYQLAEMLTINPATAAKGLAMLADASVLYKKRGLGMFVTEEAYRLITEKRKEQTLKRLIKDSVTEAGRLNVGEQELLELVRSEFQLQREDRGDNQ